MKKITEEQLNKSVSSLYEYITTLEANAPGTAPVPGAGAPAAGGQSGWDQFTSWATTPIVGANSAAAQGAKPLSTLSAPPAAPAVAQHAKPTARPASDPKVAALQTKLIAAGAKINADGVMGPKTTEAMKQFPQAAGAAPAAGAILPNGSVSSGDAAIDARLAAGATAPAATPLGQSNFAQQYASESMGHWRDVVSEQESPFRTGSTLNTMDLSGNARANQRKPTGDGDTRLLPFPANGDDTSIDPGTDATAAAGGQGTALNQIQPLGDMPAVYDPAHIDPAVKPASFTSIQTNAPHVKPNPMVKQAQQGLIAAGLLPPGSDDGIMGPNTQAAYAKFSQQNPTTMNEHVTFGQDQELARIVNLSRI